MKTSQQANLDRQAANVNKFANRAARIAAWKAKQTKPTYHIYSQTSGEVFATTDDIEFMQRELAYLIGNGYNVAVR